MYTIPPHSIHKLCSKINLLWINMAEKLSTSTMTISCPRKRRMVDEDFNVTTLNIENIQISRLKNDDAISEEQIQILSSKFLIRVDFVKFK